MPRWTFALAALAGALACGKDATRLEGHWRGTYVEGPGYEQSQTARDFVKAMELDVKGDVITVTAGGERNTSRFVVDAEDKTSLTLHTEREPQEREVFVFQGEKVMKWNVVEGRAIVTFVKDDFAAAK